MIEAPLIEGGAPPDTGSRSSGGRTQASGGAAEGGVSDLGGAIPPESNGGRIIVETSGGNGGDGGESGTGGSPEISKCFTSTPAVTDECEYPESRGGGTDPDQCGVTPRVWYPLGKTEYVAWPLRESEADVAGAELERRTGKMWNGAEWTMPADPFPDDGATWSPWPYSPQLGVLAFRKTYHGDPEDPDSYWTGEVYRSTGGPWERFWGGLHCCAYGEANILSFIDFVRGWPLLRHTVDYGEDGYSEVVLWREDLVHVRLPPGQELRVDANPQGDVLAAYLPRGYQPTDELTIILDSKNGPRTNLPTLPNRDGLRVFVDDSGVPFVSWPTDERLEIRKLTDGEWKAIPSSDDVLDTLPAEWQFQALATEHEPTQMLLRRWKNCAWQGLSASDRGGGVSNSELAVGSVAEVAVEDHRVCLSYWSYSEPHLRCHDF